MAGSIATIPVYQFNNAAGVPLVSGTLETYLAGTTTPVETFSNRALTSSNGTSITLNSRGECTLWLDNTKTYKFVLKDSSGVTIWTIDDIAGSASATDVAAVIADLAAYQAAVAASTGAALVGYLPLGTGAVATNLDEFLDRQGMVSVFNFMTDAQVADVLAAAETLSMTAPIQAAVTYAATSGKGLFFPPGTYRMDSGVTSSAGVTMQGVQGKSILKMYFTDRAGFTMFSFESAAMPTRSITGLRVDGLVFDGDNLTVNHWLQDSNFNTVDPSDDYYDAATNPTGKIGNPSYAADADGVSLSNSTNGSLGINGALASSGSVNLTAIGCRKISVTSAGNASNASYTITGTDAAGAAQVETITGPNATTVYTSVVFKTVTAVSSNAVPGAAVTVGTKEYDIFSVVADGRRNANYDVNIPRFFRITGGVSPVFSNNTFRDISGRCIVDLGSVSTLIEHNTFLNCGKDDGPFHVLYLHSHGAVGDPDFQDETYPIVRGNQVNSINRSFIDMTPTRGGAVLDNKISGWKESCIYCEDSLNVNGGHLLISGNTFRNGVISDITCSVLEAALVPNITFSENIVISNHAATVSVPGCTNVKILDNTFQNCGSGYTTPYGPYSERYDFNIGSAHIAGTAVARADVGIISVGTRSSIGCENILIRGNTVQEDRANPPSFVIQTKTGTANLSGMCVIEGNDMSECTAGMSLLNTATTNVWETNMPLFIRNNTGHASEAPVVLSESIAAGAASTRTLTPGFRPSRVDVYAVSDTAGNGRTSIGCFTWNSAATRNDFAVVTSVAAADQRATMQATDVAVIYDSAGTITFRLEFVSWSETGFVLNQTINPSTEDVTVRYVCHP